MLSLIETAQAEILRILFDGAHGQGISGGSVFHLRLQQSFWLQSVCGLLRACCLVRCVGDLRWCAGFAGTLAQSEIARCVR